MKNQCLDFLRHRNVVEQIFIDREDQLKAMKAIEKFETQQVGFHSYCYDKCKRRERGGQWSGKFEYCTTTKGY